MSFRNWEVSDDDIRQMPYELRERVANYQEQRREGQALMRQIAHPAEEEGMRTEPDRMRFPERVQVHLTVVSLQLLIVIVLLSILVARQ